MGRAADKPRKRRRRMARVSKYEDSSGNPLAGLTGNPSAGPGSGSGPAHERPGVGRLGTFFLWCLGRRRRDASDTHHEQ